LTATIVGRLLKLKYAMNWLMISSRKTSEARPANVFVIALMTSTLVLIVPAPMP
jgi:hypothetical protein